jgi:hypothetical protein
LLKISTEFEDLYDQKLGDWDTESVSLKLRDGANLYHGRSFPTPHIHKETLKEYIERVCKLGVLKWQPESEWTSSSFIVTKQNKLNDVSVILGRS